MMPATLLNRERSGKNLDKAACLYMGPDDIADPEGARCGNCIMFDSEGYCAAVAGEINGEKGGCGRYVNGSPDTCASGGTISKTVAGYIEEGPTHCANCRYFDAPYCDIVKGEVEGEGCCNFWEKL